jgi:hypothetical protein
MDYTCPYLSACLTPHHLTRRSAVVRSQAEMQKMRSVEKEHMLYDPTRFKSTAERQAALEAGGGALPPRTRPVTMRDLRRTPSKQARIHHTRSVEYLPYNKVTAGRGSSNNASSLSSSSREEEEEA